MVDIIELNCKRCGHNWVPRTRNVKKCPKCGSYLWNVEKGKEIKHVMVSEETKFDVSALVRNKLKQETYE